MIRVPDGGRMPQAAVDETGTTHLMYFVGAMTGGNLQYASLKPGGTTWSSPLRVNSKPYSAIGMGPMDAGDMALSKNDDARIHIVWYLNDPLRILYTRSTGDGAGFESQRTIWNVGNQIIEARPSITVNRQGRIHVAWNGETDAGADDAHRAVFLMMSDDGGDTFHPPHIISQTADGACGCCSLETFSADGRVWISYRSAENNVGRDQRLLTSTDGGDVFIDELIHPWSIGACPVTTTTFSRGHDTVRVAWETNGQVFFAPVNALAKRSAPKDVARYRRKNPAIATNRVGRTLLAWGDAPGYRTGGTLHWLEFDSTGRPLPRKSPGTDTISSGSGPAVVARQDDSFVVIY